MNQPEPERPLVNYPVTDTPILSQFAYPDARSIFTLFFVTIGFMFTGGILGAILLEALKYWGFKSPLAKSFVNLVAYIIGFLLTIWYAVKKSKKQQVSVFHISFNKIQGWLVPVIIICSIALNIGLERVSEIIPMPLSVQKFFEEMLTKDTFSIIAIVIAAPILEEILCRGIILKGLLKNYSPRKAILISALFFALMHMNPWQAFPAFFGGLFIGWVYYKTQSVIPGMIIHATNNAAASLFLFLPKNKQDFLSLLGEPYYIILCLFAALIFIGGCVIIQKKVSAAFNQPEVVFDQDSLTNTKPSIE
ncbi:CPBP family intramembrane glutamic endopeptidase [Mucilaginibacter sp. NFX135]|uniref:CPBP family intramembrane glutamic endopeptidase n=1 Tax=Mucilaginibacter sp. NFX135 TaxID=3402687 RepID=UPI003AFA60F3